MQKTLQVNTQQYNHLTLPLFAVSRPVRSSPGRQVSPRQVALLVTTGK